MIPDNAQPPDHAETARRRAAFQARLRAQGLDGALVQQSRNICYLTGMNCHAHVIVPAEGDPTFLVHLDFERAAEVSGIADARQGRGFASAVEALHEHGLAEGRLGLELASVPYRLVARLQAKLPGVSIDDVGDALLAVRMVKSPYELDRLREAARRSDALFGFLRETAAPGQHEHELYARLVGEARRLGCDGPMAKRGWNDRFSEHGWLVSGPQTARVSGYWLSMTGAGPSLARPYGPSDRVLEAGDLLVYDVGATADGYHSDQARTFVLGEPSVRQRELHETLAGMKQAAIDAVRPGVPAGAPYEAARAMAAEAGLEDVFMTRAIHSFPYIGHGVGLEIDEPPLLSPKDDTVLTEGMVIAIEPKLMIPGWGGLTNEDTVRVTATGSEVLTGADTALNIPIAGGGSARDGRESMQNA